MTMYIGIDQVVLYALDFLQLLLSCQVTASVIRYLLLPAILLFHVVVPRDPFRPQVNHIQTRLHVRYYSWN